MKFALGVSRFCRHRGASGARIRNLPRQEGVAKGTDSSPFDPLSRWERGFCDTLSRA